MAAAALSPAQGKNLEIGSFKGRSTVGIAYVTRELGLGKVVAVDPHTSPASTDPDLRGRGQTTSYDDFVANLQKASVLDRVEIKRAYSYVLAREWKEPIRFFGGSTAAHLRRRQGTSTSSNPLSPWRHHRHEWRTLSTLRARGLRRRVLDSDDFRPADSIDRLVRSIARGRAQFR
jgi:hypothetical protein